jgi:hypothetical protein
MSRPALPERISFTDFEIAAAINRMRLSAITILVQISAFGMAFYRTSKLRNMTLQSGLWFPA